MDLSYGRSANFANFDYYDKAEHHSEFSVSVEDIEEAWKMFGPDVSTFKVRTMIQRQNVFVGYFIEIPRELIENNQELVLCQ